MPTDYYQKSEKAEKKARERYQDLSGEEKNKKREYGHKRYKNFSEEKKR